MANNEIWLADHSGAFCDRLRVLQNDSAFYVRHDVRHPSDLMNLCREGERAPALVLVTARSLANRNEAEFMDLASICRNFIGIPIVVLCDNVCIRELASAMIAGARGFLSRNISLEALKYSLSLVLVGETALPSQLATILSENGGRQKHTPARSYDRVSRGASVNEVGYSDGHAMSLVRPAPSPREIEVLKCIANGDPNKVIAERLKITEGTVKVHVKAVLRKVQAQNRTSAAIWAIQNGYNNDAG